MAYQTDQKYYVDVNIDFSHIRKTSYLDDGGKEAVYYGD